MIKPVIDFRYSSIYNRMFGRERYDLNEVLNYIESIKELWKEYKGVLKFLSRNMKLKWHEENIICYLNSSIPFSDPLTIPMYSHKDFFVDVLIHELIHQLFTQGNNEQRSIKAWEYIHSKYKDEDRKTRIHIPLYAFHALVYLKFIKNEDRLNKDYSHVKNMKGKFRDLYLRAWDIVLEEGYQKIIDEFVNKIY